MTIQVNGIRDSKFTHPPKDLDRVTLQVHSNLYWDMSHLTAKSKRKIKFGNTRIT